MFKIEQSRFPIQKLINHMENSQKDFQVLDALDSQEITTQRQLSEHTGISLGQANYVIKSFLEKGLIKIGNFRKNRNKIEYAYLLTPKGIETKSRLAVKFVLSRLKEYNTLKQRLADRLFLIEQKGHFRLIYVGPEMIKELVVSIIKEKRLKLKIVDSQISLEDIKKREPVPFDLVLLFDENAAPKSRSKKVTGIPASKIMPLW